MLFILWLMEHLSYFSLLATMSNVTMNIYIQILDWPYIFSLFLGIYLGLGFLGHMVTVYLTF